MIRDNLTQLEPVARLAAANGARVVNFLAFNPYFEWEADPHIPFQARHSEIAPYLMRAIDICAAAGIEANVRYMPPCQLPGYEQHVYTGFQLPFDPREWDFNSWYDTGYEGQPDPDWYADAARRQQARHGYQHVPACGSCALRQVCDGFHGQYAARFGGTEAVPYPGPPVTDPCHFTRSQLKIPPPPPPPGAPPRPAAAGTLRLDASGGATARHPMPPGP